MLAFDDQIINSVDETFSKAELTLAKTNSEPNEGDIDESENQQKEVKQDESRDEDNS